MAVYALSGIILIFRDTDFLKQEKIITQEIKTNATPDELGELLKIKQLKVEKQDGNILFLRMARMTKQAERQNTPLKNFHSF